MPGVWPAVAQNSTKYPATARNQAAAGGPCDGSEMNTAGERRDERDHAAVTSTMSCAIAASMASPTARDAMPA